MVKALEEMNIKLSFVLSDIKSVSGQRIIKAIVEGEQNPNELIKLVHHKVKAKREYILKALKRTWRTESLFELKQSYDTYNFLQKQTKECDAEIEKQLIKIAAIENLGDISDIEDKGELKKNRIEKMNIVLTLKNI